VAKRQVKDQWTQETWRGSPAEFADLVSEAAALVTDGGQDPDAHISIGKGDDDLSFDSVSEFSEFSGTGDRRLREARQVYAAVGPHGGVRVTLVLSAYRVMGMKALWATVRSSDPVAASGASAEVRKLARQNGGRFSLWISAVAAWAVGLALTIPHYFSDSGITGALSWAGTGLMIAAFLFGVFQPLLVPHFELIDPDAPETGAMRFRRWLAGSAKWVAAVVAGAVIYALAEKAING
jgi:hypothetical protein